MLAKKGRLKRYRQRVKQYRQNRTFQNNERKFYQQLGGSDTKTYQQLDAKETERFWTKIWQPKKHNENTEWINNITRELERLEEGPKTEIHINLLKTTLKRISNRKTPGHDGIHGFWFKKFTSVHSRLALEMNRCLQGVQVPDLMTKGKTTLIQKDPSKGTAPNDYRPITCLPMMQKILTAQIRGKDLLLAYKPRIVPWRTERMPQRIQRHSRITLHRSTHPKWEQDKTEKFSYGLDWQQKGIWYGPTKLDNTLSQNVQNITWSHKLHRKDHANLESGADSRRKKLSWNKDPKRDFPKRCTITLTIHDSHDAT